MGELHERVAYALADRIVRFFGAVATGARGAVCTLDEVRMFLVHGIDFAPSRRRSFEAELRELVEPSIPILIHKRAKFLTPADGGTIRHDLWSRELSDFMNRVFFWPNLGAHRGFVDRNGEYVADLLDRLIEAEQRKAAQAVDRETTPMTSRFDTSWAV